MPTSDPLRRHLQRALDWEDAHTAFDTVVEGIPEGFRGIVPQGFAHSAWQLVEHLRLAQQDILDFCRNPDYEERTWPDDYWPDGPEPPSPDAWTESVAGFQRDREALKDLVGDAAIDLLARIPHGSGQTYLREALLVIDHTAYHVGQLLDVRRALGAWAPA